MIVPIFIGLSSTKPTMRIPMPGFWDTSRATATPAEPAPIRRVRFSTDPESRVTRPRSRRSAYTRRMTRTPATPRKPSTTFIPSTPRGMATNWK